MKQFLVSGGAARFGQGDELQLTPAQIATRLARLDLPEGFDGKTPAIVKVKAPIEFKVGEILGLAELERRLVDVLVPVGEPKTEDEKIALRKAEERESAAAAKAKDAAKEAAKDGKGKRKS